MESIRVEFSDDRQTDGSDIEQFRIKLQWAEFALRKRIVNCLLGLLIISTIFALLMGWLSWQRGK